ncbi:MAG TPA: histidine phosphatase family protein [Solirubrobacteraceae bacterium]|nr:histidine phosphatase family protein [Solirubrobacteraceae bacterium]
MSGEGGAPGGKTGAPGGPIVLARHAETEWSRDGRHTGRSDIPLTDRGRAAASALAGRLGEWRFALVLVSPLLRARETCELCGLGAQAQPREDLLEWDYGEYEGLTTPQIRERRPGWSLWRDGCPGGESATEVGARADRVIAECGTVDGPVAVFSHGHLLRVLGARWIALDPAQGARLGLSTGAICVLGHERATPILARWNDTGAKETT